MNNIIDTYCFWYHNSDTYIDICMVDIKLINTVVIIAAWKFIKMKCKENLLPFKDWQSTTYVEPC